MRWRWIETRGRLPALAKALGLAILVAAALLLSAVRLALPLADDYRDAVARTLGQRLGYQVSLGTLTLSLSGLDPRLTLHRVRLTDPRTGADVLSLKAMELDLDVLGSLRTASPQFQSMTLVGARLMVRRLRDGRVRVTGLDALRNENPRALELFLRQGHVNLVDTEILLSDEGLGGDPLRLVDVCLRLGNHGRSHWLDLSARLAPVAADPGAARIPAADSLAGDDNRLHLIADLQGPADDLRSWDGRVYARLGLADLAGRLPSQPPGVAALASESVLLESWNRIRHGRLEQSLSRINLVGLTLTPSADTSAPGVAPTPVSIRRLHALARARPLASGWRLRVADLNASVEAGDLSGLDVDARISGAGVVERMGLAAGRVDLANVASILRASPWRLPPSLAALLDARPRGRLDDLALRVERPSQPETAPRWAVSAVLSGLGFDQTPAVPGIEGLGVRLSADQDGGELRLGSGGLVIDWRPLFSERLMLDQFSGRLSWRRDDGGAWHLSGRHVNLGNADLAGRARLDLDIPADGSSPFLDLRARFHDGDASKVRSYLPVGMMQPDLVTWLEASIRSGRIAQADLVLRGPLADYPFRQHQGRFELLLAFEDLLLDYQKGWPPINSAAGHLRFLNQGLSIAVDRGRLYDAVLSGGKTAIPDLWFPTRMLIHGEGEGPMSDGRRILAESPLAKDLGRLAEAMEVSGDLRLALDIDLPLVKNGYVGIAGHLSWPKPATLGIKGTPINLSKLDGTLRFTENSLDAKAIKARLWGRPVRLDIATQGAGNPETSTTRIEAQARTPVSELARRFPNEFWDTLGGDLDWQLAVSLRNRDVSRETPALGYRLSSRLKGLSIALPPPLGKAAGVARALELEGTLMPDQSIDIAGHLGELGANLNFDLAGGDLAGGSARLVGGRLRLGETSAPVPDRSGLFLDGSLDELDLPAWLAWFDIKPTSKAGTAGGEMSALAGADLRIQRLLLGDLGLTGVSLGLDPLASGWEVRVNADELAGTLRLPAEADRYPLDLALDRLDLRPLFVQSPERNPASPVSPDADRLNRIPSLDLRVADLRWGKVSLGRLDLGLRNETEGIRLPALTLDGNGLSARGDGDWTRSDDGGRSRLDLALEVADLSTLLQGLDEKPALEAERVKASLRLNWPGGFGEFALKRAAGAIDLEVGQGRFLEVEPGVGRLLGFLNIGALNRRLALDFSDLYGQGFAFERMAGRISIADGTAGFDDFTIDGTAGKVIVGGLTNLMTRRFDQRVTVEPKIGSGVALASAVAGGPVVGAAVYLIDRVAGNPIDRLGRYRYRVIGPWDEPEVRRLGWNPLLGTDAPQAGSDDAAARMPSEKNNLFLDLE